MQYLFAFCSQPEATSDLISGGFVGPVVSHNLVKFGDPCLNLSREIPPEAAFSRVFHGSFLPEVWSDVISSVVINQTGVKEVKPFSRCQRMPVIT